MIKNYVEFLYESLIANMTRKIDLEKETLENEFYRKVLQTTPTMQLALMCIKPGEETGFEIHKDVSQFIRIEGGTAKITIDDADYELESGESIIVYPNSRHNISNETDEDVKLYTIYAPPVHEDGLIEREKPNKLAEDINEMIKRKGKKWVVLTSDGRKVLGTHDTKKEALAQLRAIEISKRSHNK